MRNCKGCGKQVLAKDSRTVFCTVSCASSYDKLTYICPNCHRLVHSNKIKPDDLIPLTKQIGNRWKDFYFGSVEGKRLLLGV